MADYFDRLIQEKPGLRDLVKEEELALRLTEKILAAAEESGVSEVKLIEMLRAVTDQLGSESEPSIDERKNAGRLMRVAEAYGWLWHVIGNDKRVHRARHLLRDLLDADQMRWGISKAMEEGARLTDKTAQRRYRINLDGAYGRALLGHWFWIVPADEYAEAALLAVLQDSAQNAEEAHQCA